MQLTTLLNFQTLSKSCNFQVQEAGARLFEEFKNRFYPVEEICFICRKKCSKILHCNGSCNRYFGQNCLSKSSYDSYITSDNWVCKLCSYNESISKTILKNVDPKVDEILNQLQLSKFRTLFYKTPFDTFRQYTLSDFCELNIPLGPRLKLSKYLNELHFKSINYKDYSLEYLNKIVKYNAKPFIDVTNQNIRDDEIKSITPSMIVINSISPFPDKMTKEELSNCSKFVRTLKQVGMKTFYRLHHYHKPYNYNNFNTRSIINFCRNGSKNMFEPDNKRKAKEYLNLLEDYVYYNDERCYNRVFTSHEILKKIAEFVLSKNIFESEDIYIDMCCGENIFGSFLPNIKYKGYDIFPPKYNSDAEHFTLYDWFNVYNLPKKGRGNYIVGLKPPCNDDYSISKRFILHAFELFPKYVILYLPSVIKNAIAVPDYFTLYLTQSFETPTDSFYLDEDSALPLDAEDIMPDNMLYIWKRNEKYIEYKNQLLKDKQRQQQQYYLKHKESSIKRNYNNNYYNFDDLEEGEIKFPRYN